MEISRETREKLGRLENAISSAGSAAAAFSGGADSAFLLYTAHRVLGGAARAFTVASCASPVGETAGAEAFCSRYGIGCTVISADLLALDRFRENPPDRCYHCKKYIFERIIKEAAARGISCVMEGSNADDAGDYRPGMRAVRELGVLSPLLEAGLTKAEIRALSREAGLPTWDKPPSPCLATRFPYGEEITAEGLAAVGQAEELLRVLGFPECRVRRHGAVARIEVPRGRIADLAAPGTREKIAEGMLALGFEYAAADLEGFRSGSLNRPVINAEGESADPPVSVNNIYNN